MRELRRLLGYLGPYRRDLLIAAVMIILETAFEMVIPVLMADIIDVGVANRDVAVILQRGIQMGVCALLALATGLLYAALPPGPPMAGTPTFVRPSLSGCRNMPFPTWTNLRPPHW